MNIEEFVATFQCRAPEFALTRCIVNGSIMNLSEIECMGYDEFAFGLKLICPYDFTITFLTSPKKTEKKA